MGYRLNRLDEPILIAVSKSLLTEFGIHLRLESCGQRRAKVQEMTVFGLKINILTANLLGPSGSLT